MSLKCVLLLWIQCLWVLSSEVNPCTTPNGELSTCISLFSCPGLMKAIGTLERLSVQHVHKSICPIGTAGEWYVCCGKEDSIISNTSPSPTLPSFSLTSKVVTPKPSKKPTATPKPQENDKKAHREMVKRTLLPDRSYCGLQHTDDRFYNDSRTALDEFPWLVHIKITDLAYEEEYGDRCSGVLISNRYVLTDAYCAYHAIKVVVGEHRTDTNKSCLSDTPQPECTDLAYEVRVESIIRDGKQENGPFDFALLRLNETITYSDFVRAICLPLFESDRPAKNAPLTFSGWGSQGPGVVVKKRISYEQTVDKECYDAEVGIEGNVKFANVSLLCVKPKKNNTNFGCTSDHGGPLMHSKKLQWFAEAIVIQVFASSFGCSDKAPAASIKITSKTIDWILDTIRP